MPHPPKIGNDETSTIESAAFGDKAADYRLLLAQAAALIHGERDFIANAANLLALLFHSLNDLNWAGLYLRQGDTLVLGPFQGKPACVRIDFGKGVCGTAAERRSSVVVDDVHAFAGHIACDSASNAEIVIPLLAGEQLIGVLDLDSPVLARFDAQDQEGLEKIAAVLICGSDWAKHRPAIQG